MEIVVTWFALSAFALAALTLAALLAATRWPHPGRDVILAIAAGAASAAWVVLDGAHPGAVLWRPVPDSVVTLADLACLPALLLAGLLIGRTAVMSQRRASAEREAQAAERVSRAEAAERASQDEASEDSERPAVST